ncbi:hypothetical protein [Phenylobacterium sp.]|uniref:hypothetical protein n=1 Tax=Phenylobacterium sp. TaxID=1871053 RepID=UPI002DF3F378|nr:hypothetical protein [Phenylobacterium sp.]
MSWTRIPTAALLAAGLAAGCATPKPPPATLSFTGRDCAAAPDLAKAVSLTPPKPKPMFVVTTPIGAQVGTPVAGPPACLERAGAQRPYALYALPKDPAGKTLMVGSVLEGARIFSPEVALLDATGQVTRSFTPADYFYRADVYSVQFQPKAGETYILVDADPARVSRRYDSIAIGVNTTATYVAGVGAVTIRTGVDAKQSRTFSYDGQVQVTVYDAAADAKKK